MRARPPLADRLRASAHWSRRQFELGHDGIRRMIGGASGDLRQGLSRKRAVDTSVAMTAAEAHGTLVLERGWIADEFGRWLTRTVVGELLGGIADG